jgi:uncharacterized protein (DUF2384 family)
MKELNDLCQHVRTCIKGYDETIRMPESHERGKQLAQITNALEMALDVFERFHKAKYHRRRPTCPKR